MVLDDGDPSIKSDGQGNDDDGDEDGKVVEQRPGHKAHLTRGDGNDNEEDNEPAEPRTRPYKIKEILSNDEMDAQFILEMDLNFFHLSVLAKMLQYVR